MSTLPHINKPNFPEEVLEARAGTLPQTEVAAQAVFLQVNSESYEWLAGKIQTLDRHKEAEEILRCIEKAARFAAMYHTGRFADGTIENAALEIGADLDKLAAGTGYLWLPTVSKDGRRRVLHVTFNVREVGGHTRLMHHWVRNDPSSCHSILLVNQPEDIPVPLWLFEAVRSSGGHLVTLPPKSGLCQKAKWLRTMAKRSADLVVLHTIWPDVVPTVAFATHDCPPVVVVDQCDHMFELGSSVGDMLISLRTLESVHMAKRRFLPRNAAIPIPLVDTLGDMSRRDARRTLGIDEHQIVLLSVGRDLKYRPCGPYDFVATANRILNRQPGAHLYVVGESAAGIAPYLRCAIHDRLHFVGSVEDPSLYRAAADIYLESFPFGSQTALLEAALGGLPVVPAYAPLCPMLVAHDEAISDILTNPQDEREYVKRVELLIRQPEERVMLGKALRERLLTDHVGEGWLNRLTAVYQHADRLMQAHDPRPIPVSICANTDADIGLSHWSLMGHGNIYFTATSEGGEEAVLIHSSLVTKWAGDFSKARRFAWRAIQHNPYRWAVWRLFLSTMLSGARSIILKAGSHIQKAGKYF
jgi:glycosyltransferase involved in cell wall biosynthesis